MDLKRASKNLRRVVSGVTYAILAAALICILWFGYKLVTNPLPYEYTNLKYQPNIQVCPGESFKYSVELHKTKDAITVIKTENFFSEDPDKSENFFFDTFENREIFPWDDKVPSVLMRNNTVVVPKTNPFGMKVSSGKFRYISSLSSEGIKNITTISIPFEIPESCFD